MWKIFSRILFYKSFYKFNFPKLYPVTLTINLTNRCNCRCLTCNIWKDIPEEISISEYEKIFKTIKSPPYWIILTGGEPFLREDIVDICKLIRKYIKPKFLNISTNATVEKTYENLLKILESLPDVNITVNISIDGDEELHNRIRNGVDVFKRAIENFKKLKEIKFKNFTLGTGTVISKFNVKNAEEIINLLKKLQPSSSSFEIAQERKELKTENILLSPEPEEYKNFLRKVETFTKTKKYPDLTSRINKSLRIVYYKLTEEIITKKIQVIPCYAGFASCYISCSAEVWECCVKGRCFGNLRDVNYDFSKLWFSKKADEIRKEIKEKKCYCPLASTTYTNILFDFKSLIKAMREFFR